jgi:uncharacterized coiled-coil protein SlyX
MKTYTATAAMAILVALISTSANLRAQSSTLEGRIADLEFRMHLREKHEAELSAQMATLQKQLTSVQSKATNLEKRAYDIEQAVVSLNLEIAQSEKAKEIQNIEQLQKDQAKLEQAVNDLRLQVAHLPRGGPTSVVRAPFKVVNDAGKALMEVSELAGGGNVEVVGPDGMVFVGIGIRPSGPTIAVRANNRIVATMQARDGDGVLAVGPGKGVAILASAGDHGELVISNSSGPVVHATTNAQGLGEVAIVKGSAAKAYIKEADDGTGGATCAVRNDKLWCVGINVPLQAP